MSASESTDGQEMIKFLQEKIDYLQKTLPDICKTHLLWRGCSPIPCGVVRPHVVTDDTNIYVGGGNSGRMEFTRTVMKYDIVANKWSCLPITAFHTFSLVLINGLVTVIGGYNVVTACVSNTLTSFDKGSNKWCMRFPPMLTKRSASSAVAALSHVVVVGGISDNESNYVDVVEVLDTASMVWSICCSFPMPVTFMSIALCSLTERIYVLGGLTCDGAVRSVFSCTLPELVATSNQLSREDNIWKVITDSPYCRSGGAAINGKLIIASGLEESGDVSNTVHCFDPGTAQWTELGDMPSAKSSCSIAVLSGGQILTVGGYLKPKNWIGSLTKDVMATVNLNVPLMSV